MEPSLKNGDLVFFKRYFANKSILKSGEIIIFNHPLENIKLIKRVKTINEFSVEVYGDNKEYSKDSEFFGFIQKSKILGIVTSTFRINSLRKLSPFNS